MIADKLRGFINRNFYFLPFWSRRLSEYKAICDICNTPVGFSDYGYMCRQHGEIIYKYNFSILPKFFLRVLFKAEVKNDS